MMSFPRAALALACLGLLGYFAHNLFQGDYGLDEHARLEAQVRTLQSELKGLEAVRERLESNVALMRAGQLDPDMLDERAREVLNFAHPGDIVIMNEPSSTRTRP